MSKSFIVGLIAYKTAQNRAHKKFDKNEIEEKKFQ